MEKVKNVRKHGNDFVLRILSVIIAVIIWFALSITQYPTISRSISNIPVTFSLDGTQAEEKGLSVLNKEDIEDISVDVEIKGMNYEIGGYTASDLIASVDLSSVTKEGTYELDIDVRSSHTTDRVTITSITPPTVSVSFDKITEKTVPVNVDAPLVTAEEGYTLRDTTVTPDELTIEGPQNEIDKISKATIDLKTSMKITEETVINTDDFKYYDEDDNEVKPSGVTLKNTKSFDVDFVVYKKKTINLNVAFENASTTFDKSSLPMNMSEETLSVATPDLDSDEEENIILGTIDLTEVDLTNKYTFVIPLDDDEVNMSGEDQVTVTFDPTDYISKDLAVSSDNFVLLNKPSGKDITFETKKISGVTVYGPESVISKLTADDLYLQVDLSGVQANGSYSKLGIVYSPKYNNIWGYGSNEIQVVVSNISNSNENSATEE
ncbi:MAG: hypothetical protein IJ571_01240 [Ruminococcus sp.]|nr:hypothetical protein [Ruminococcus sp.]